MVSVLLLITDENLRQLYHRLLFSKNIELMVTSSIENAVVWLTIRHFHLILFYADDQKHTEVETFLRLRQKQTGWKQAQLILLSSISDTHNYQKLLTNSDLVLNPLAYTPTDLIKEVKTHLKKEK